MSKSVWAFIGQLVTNMLSTDKESKQAAQFHYSPRAARSFRGRSLIARGKSLGNYNGSRGPYSKTTRATEPRLKEYITPQRLALEKNTNFNKGVWAIGKSGSHLLLLTLREEGETRSVIATLSQTVKWNSH